MTKIVSISRSNAVFFVNITAFNYSYDRLKLKHTSLVNYDFTSNKQDAAVQQEKEEKLQTNEQSIVKTKKQQLSENGTMHLLSWDL